MDKKQFKVALGNSFRAAEEREELNAYSLEEAFNNKWISSVSNVMSTKPNGYKAVVVKDANGQEACFLLGKRSAENTPIGTKPERNWSIIVATNADGEQRVKVSTNSREEFTLEDLK